MHDEKSNKNTSNKTIRNKKINYTEPGKSTRNYKNKPLDERVGPPKGSEESKSASRFISGGPRNSKQTNKIFSKKPKNTWIKGKRNARSKGDVNYYDIDGEPKIIDKRKHCASTCTYEYFSEIIRKLESKYANGNNDAYDTYVDISSSGKHFIATKYTDQNNTPLVGQMIIVVGIVNTSAKY